MADSEKLFAGEGQLFGGLSNEEELIEICPAEFKNGNAWSSYAMALFYEGANIKNWKWKLTDNKAKGHQLSCLKGLLGTFGIPHQDKLAIAGWMLSEMLNEIPEHIPVPKEAK